MNASGIQYISDENGDTTGVIVPIDLWKNIEAELETSFPLKSDAMKKRLLEARGRDEGIPFDEVLDRLGIE